MALGNYDNNKKEYYTPTYFSQYGTGNENGIDPSSLSYTFFNRMLKISISPLKADNGDKIAYDHDKAAAIWLTHTKARMFYEEIKKVLNGELTNGGVNSGDEGLIRFIDGKELGINNYCLVINKIDSQTGASNASYAYEFKTKHHYAIENFNPNDASHKKVYYKNIEIEQLLDVLHTYYMSMTGAYAYSVMDANKYETNKMNTKMDLTMSKLGVEYKTGMTSRSSSRSYFDTNEPSSNDRSMRQASMEDLE